MLSRKFYIRGNENAQVPAHLNFGKYIFDRLCLKEDEVAIESAETNEKLTYKELTQYAVKLSLALTKLGVRKADVVAFGSEARIMYVPTSLAVILSGATYTPYELNAGKGQLQNAMNLSQPKYVICTEKFWKKHREVLEKSITVKNILTLDSAHDALVSVNSLITSLESADEGLFEPVIVQGQLDAAVIVYSSGTTGMSKGVLLSHLNCILYTMPLESTLNDESLKVGYVTGDFLSNAQIFILFKMLALGRKIIYTVDVSPETIINAFENFQVNFAFLEPSSISKICKAEVKSNENYKSLQYVYSTGSPIHIKTMEQFKQRFPSVQHILQRYGMTEAWGTTSEDWGIKGPRPGSVGCVAPASTLKIVHPKTRALLGPNQHGEICVKGPKLMKGYIGIDCSTIFDDEGFYKTGDLGYYDEDKYFYIVDRLKEIINHGGWQVPPLELETILQLHPGVREAGVVGKPVPVYGEEPTAFVVRQPGSDVTAQELIDYVANEVIDYMQLRGGVIFISQLPRNPRGKLLRRRLREMLNE